MKTEIPDNWNYLSEKIANAYAKFKSIDDYRKLVNNLKKEDFFTERENNYPNDEDIEWTEEIIEQFKIHNGEELTK